MSQSAASFRHCFHLPVRWGDMDAYGHVNNVQFFRYIESARVAYLQEVLGSAVGGQGENVIVADCQLSFLQQVTFPAELRVGSRIARLGRSSFTMAHELWRTDAAAPVARGQTVLVWFDFAGQRPVPLPDALRTRVMEYEPSLA